MARGGGRLVKAGWRVRRAQARRHGRLLRDVDHLWAGTLLGPGASPGQSRCGPGGEGEKTQQTCGSVQAVPDVQAESSKSPQEKIESNRIAHAHEDAAKG